MSNTSTVKIFLVNGDSDSLRTAEISNWSGLAVTAPRSQLGIVLRRPEAERPGVYFLTGVNPATGKERVYIGEAELIKNRIKGHLRKAFWNNLTFFVSKDENLTKAHIKYLEGELIQRARNAGRYEVENTNLSGSRLPEADSADMNVFLARMELLLPVLSQDFLKPLATSLSMISQQALLTCAIKNLSANGRVTVNGFLVLRDSEAVIQERPSTGKFPYASTLRKQLLEEQVLQNVGDRLKFQKDYEFSSPSAAVAVIHGGLANGLTAWRGGDGRTLKEIEETASQ